MGWADWMVVDLTLEEQLQLEREARSVLSHDDHTEIAALCAQLVKQTHYQQILLNQAVGRITELEAESFLHESTHVEEERRLSWWQRILPAHR
jgi:hypothetical protein